MQILNIGSINIDHVYKVDHFVRPGETLASFRYDIFSGGKGFNQSVALARAGADTLHAGRVGQDASWLLQRLEREGVDISRVSVTETPTGHAIIQVVPSGENAIVLYGGANKAVGKADIAHALTVCSPGDYLLLQNEISSVPEAIERGAERGLRVVFNPAPITPAIRDYPLDRVDIFILNETEAAGLTGKTAPDDALIAMRRQFPSAATVLTLGSEGAIYSDAARLHRQPAIPVAAIDTTAAGDTFIGYFLAGLMQGGTPAAALALGCRAAAICVTRAGASDSIPTRSELESLRPDEPGACEAPRN
jgi:ribokinase